MSAFLESTWFLWWILTVVGIVRWFKLVAHSGPADADLQERNHKAFTSGSPVSRVS